MRIIISGGSGLIGSELVKELHANGLNLIILSRNPGRITNPPSGMQVVRWDGKTSQGWGHLVEGTEAIINLAAENIAGDKFFPARWTIERKKSILKSRFDSGKAMIEAIRAAGNKPGLLVQSSAIGYYGPLNDEIVDENWPTGGDFLAKTCQAWEGSTEEVEGLGVRRVIIRTGVVLSIQGGAFVRLLLPFKLFAGGPIGNGKQYLSWIHMADQVGAIRFLIENPVAQGVYNLTAPQPVTNAVLARTIGQVMGRPSFIPVPAFVFRMLFGEVATVVVDGQRVLPNRLQQLGYSFQFKQIEEAVRNLLRK
jgi:uncharacterized protein (TIGR01777 family)